MTFWVAGAVVGSAVIGASASRSASRAQAAAAEQGIDAQERMFERQVELSRPYREAGETALNKLVPLATEYTPFGMAQFQADPGYGFRLSEGQKALERSTAARVGLQSGAALKAAARYGQEMGSQEFQNAFNRFQTERQARLNPLQSLAGVGQTSAQNLAGQAGQMGQNIAEGLGSAAAARAAGYVGGANALNQGLSTYLNYSQGQNMLNALRAPSLAAYQTPGYGAPTIGYQDPYASFRYGSST
jgi:hypothetical protein